MRSALVVLWMLLCSITSATAQVSVGIGLPGVNIGINVPVYPELVRVPGYPVYYAPRMNSNFFFYDGMYWVYQSDNWYASSWYNGPWGLVGPEVVPVFILRVPVRYYRQPPVYFGGWRADGPPRWGEHWGNSWEQNHRGWDHWNRGSAPAPAPLPVYQRQYSGSRYPQVQQQQVLQTRNYRYQPRDATVQQHYQATRVQGASAPSSPPAQRSTDRPPPQQLTPPVQRTTQQASPPGQRPPPHPQQPQAEHEQRQPNAKGQDKGPQGKGAEREGKQGKDKAE